MEAGRSILIVCALTLAGAGASPAQGADSVAEDAPRFATTPFLEPDRCATAWVIVRYVDARATFSFHQRDDLPDDAEWFDLPEAELKRDARRTTLEVLVEREEVTDPFVMRLVRLIHDIEINAWATRREAGSRRLETELMDAFERAGSAERGIAVCFEMLDRLRQSDGDVDSWQP